MNFTDAVNEVVDTFTLGHPKYMTFKYTYEGRTQNELNNNHLDSYYTISGGPFGDIFRYSIIGSGINHDHHAQGQGIVRFAATDFFWLVFKVDPDLARQILQKHLPDEDSIFIKEITITNWSLT